VQNTKEKFKFQNTKHKFKKQIPSSNKQKTSSSEAPINKKQVPMGLERT